MYDGLDVRAVSAPPPPSHPTALVQQREICRLVRAADGLRGRPHAAACAPERPCAVCRPFATGMQAARLEAARADLAAARAAAPPRAVAVTWAASKAVVNWVLSTLWREAPPAAEEAQCCRIA